MKVQFLFLYTDLMCRMRFACVKDDEYLVFGILSLILTVNLTTKLFDRFGPTLHRNLYIKIRHAYIFYYKELKKMFERKVKRRRNGARNMTYNKLRSCYSSHNNIQWSSQRVIEWRESTRTGDMKILYRVIDKDGRVLKPL